MVCVMDELTTDRETAGCAGVIQGEQQRQRSSGELAVWRLAVAVVCGVGAKIASGPVEFIGADRSHQSKAQ